MPDERSDTDFLYKPVTRFELFTALSLVRRALLHSQIMVMTKGLEPQKFAEHAMEMNDVGIEIESFMDELVGGLLSEAENSDAD